MFLTTEFKNQGFHSLFDCQPPSYNIYIRMLFAILKLCLFLVTFCAQLIFSKERKTLHN